MRRFRVIRPRRHHGWGGAGVTGGLLFLLASTVAAPVHAQSPDTEAAAEQAVADAQARADRAASAYFDALEHANRIDRDITELQAELDRLESEVARLRRATITRAVEAYKRAGTPFANAFGDAAALRETTHRTMVLDTLNSQDRAVADEFRQLREDRGLRQDELAAAKDEARTTVERLEAEEGRLNALLVKAQNERRALVAQREAAEAVAQAAAATPTPAAEPAADGSTPASAAPTSTSSPARSTSPAPTPAPPPPDYTPRTGTHPHHDHPFLSCTRQRESGGNYQAYNPAGPYLGAYQFSQSTWNSTANHAGRGDLVGLDPRRASQYDQDDMAWTLYQWRGKGPWNGLC